MSLLFASGGQSIGASVLPVTNQLMESVSQSVSASCSVMTLCDLMVEPSRLLCPWNSLGKNTGVGGHLLLDGNLPNLGIKPGSPALQWILYHLSQQGSPCVNGK